MFTYVGRVSAEKNLDDFLVLDLPGTKLVVGDGPQLASYRERYPDVVFAGWKRGEELSRYYSASDVFVLPSRFETFGLVLLEALACGLPVAAYPVPGPIDVIGKAPVGVLDHDLRHAALRALSIPRKLCREFALRFSWRRSAEEFVGNLMPDPPARPGAPAAEARNCFTAAAVSRISGPMPSAARPRPGHGARGGDRPWGKISVQTGRASATASVGPPAAFGPPAGCGARLSCP